jgi:hypothetical protein
MLTAVANPILRPFRASDATSIVNQDGPQVSPAFTAEVDGAPIGCAGLVLLWPGVGSAWMVLSAESTHHGFWLTRTVKAFLKDMEVRYSLHRIDAVALEESSKNQAWLEALGFHVEPGRATAYLSDRRSVIRYERIKE